ncbi:DUF6602 domain-containing protein (plasmid) [Bacillus sp. C-3-6]
MGNYLEKILDWNAEILREHFEHSERIFKKDEEDKIFHNGEYGKYREDACKDFVKSIIPGHQDVSDGFLINTEEGDEGISTQCDIVVFDKSSPIFSASHIKFFTVETVTAIGEVKSTLDTGELIDALIKLAKNKEMRVKNLRNCTVTYRDPQYKSQEYDPYTYHVDHMMSFLICKKIDAINKKKLMKKIEKAYVAESINEINRHNMILSLEDGLFLYWDPYNTELSDSEFNWAYPMMTGQPFKQRFLEINPKDINYHFKQFAHHLFLGLSSTTVIHPETALYFNWEKETSINKIDL